MSSVSMIGLDGKDNKFSLFEHFLVKVVEQKTNYRYGTTTFPHLLSYHVAQAGLLPEPTTFLPLCWNYSCTPPCLPSIIVF